MTTRLFHFSEDGSIDKFEPRSVLVASERSSGHEWLNDPLVWAIDDWHQPMYLFPRDCPRILLWRTSSTTALDAETYFAGTDARMVAYVEERWLAKLQSESIFRYELPVSSFQSLDDAGMWVSKTEVHPIEKTCISNLPNRLEIERVNLRILDSLTPLRGAWKSSLHVSGIRLRNAQGWIG